MVALVGCSECRLFVKLLTLCMAVRLCPKTALIRTFSICLNFLLGHTQYEHARIKKQHVKKKKQDYALPVSALGLYVLLALQFPPDIQKHADYVI